MPIISLIIDCLGRKYKVYPHVTSTWCCRTFCCCTAAKGRRPPHTPKVSPAPPPWHLGRHDDDLAKYPILPGLAGDVVKPFDYHSLHFIFWSFYSEKEHFDIHTHCACFDTAAELLPAAAAKRQVGREAAAAYSAEEYSCAGIRQTGEMRNLNFWKSEFCKWLSYGPQEMRGIW